MDYKNLWAPWRNDYLKSLEPATSTDQAPAAQKSTPPCFLCRCWTDRQHDQENLLLWRTTRCLVVFNRFPYTAGHLLIAPAAHLGNLSALDEPTLLELILLLRDAQKLLTEAIRPHGFNIGANINRCAGAGLPDHLHWHLVPRWDGDTNFMAAVAQVRVISQSLDDLYRLTRQLSPQLNLPSIPEKSSP